MEYITKCYNCTIYFNILHIITTLQTWELYNILQNITTLQHTVQHATKRYSVLQT